MRLTDLELYRWKFHNDIYIHTTNKYRPNNLLYNWTMYWKEYGAFTSVLPRQVGKTEMIITLVCGIMGETEDYRVACANKAMRHQYDNRGLDKKKYLKLNG